MSGTDNVNSIVKFFLNLYRIQLGVKNSDPEIASFNSIGTEKKEPEKIFELKVNRSGKWQTRRMTVCPLSEGGASKSACYKVVYDDILVIKIPSNPIKSFENYLKAVRSEQKISQRLSPDIPCLSPNFEAILSKFPHFRNLCCGTTADLEKKLIEKVKSSPGLQACLKIENSFVLFMSLSRHSFFSDVLTKLQNKDGQIKEEIIQGMECTETVESFENRYGKGTEDLFYSLNDLIRKFDWNLSQLLKIHGIDEYSLPEIKRRKCFFQGLAKKPLELDLSKFGPDFLEDIEKLLSQMFETEKDIILQYQGLIDTIVNEKNFSRNVAIGKGIIVNLLNLLGYLKERGVALRDLKPENMFLIGESEDPENFLRTPDRYRIGLIDLETCVIFENEEDLDQPLLAGTPEYATPSHLFENDILQSAYSDIHRIFWIQDWYAALAMIFKTIVARPLFEKTAPLIHEIIRVKRRSIERKIPLLKVFKEASWIFWTSAVNEFNDNICGRASILKSTSLSLQKMEANMLAEQMVMEKEKTKKTLHEKVGNQNFFTNEQTRNDLLKSSPPALKTFAELGVKGKSARKHTKKTRIQMALFFKELIAIKLKMAEQHRLLKLLYEKYEAISVYDLLTIMFMVTVSAMYDPIRTGRVDPEIRVVGFN